MAIVVPASASAAEGGLNAYRVKADAGTLQALAREGYDVAEGRAGGIVEIAATAGQAAKLQRMGLKPRRARSARAKAAGVRPDGSYDVYRPYFDKTYVGTDASGARRQTLYEELRALAADHPGLVKAVEIGRSLRGVPILALKVTRNARAVPDGRRPAVLYSSTQHAREWITPEMTRRLAHHVVDHYGEQDEAGRRITRILNSTELWFVVVANPDGYDFTFSPGNRLWRKNLRDVDGDGQVASGDGVDLNRNFATNWNYDDEGSSSDPSSETYRGSAPSSEPETRAMDGLLRRIRFAFQVNYHSAAELLLYPFGFQVETYTADDPIYEALSGTDEAPAIPGKAPGAPHPYDPDVAAELYTTNGETTDHAHTRYGTLAWTPEMDVADPARGGGASVFEFQDSEADLADAFEKNIPFALDVADSAGDPAEPVSHLGNRTPDFEVKSFSVSYGDPQPVEADVKRSLGAVRVHWSINGGPTHSAAAREYRGGERYGGPGDVYYHRVRGQVRGTRPGDRVRVWVEAGGERSGAFTYAARSESGAPVLILAAEDYSGVAPNAAPGPGPAYLRSYQDALRAAGLRADVYDVDAEGRSAPDPLGVLGHYRAVLWYTGDDEFVRDPGMGAGTGTSKLADDEILAVRDYLNDGGKLLYTGENAAFAQLTGFAYNPAGQPPYCAPGGPVANCVPLSDDFLQYWLGAYLHIEAAATKEEASALAMRSAGGVFGTAPITLNGPGGADNQSHVYSMVTTSSLLPAATYPLFASEPAARFDRPPAFDPPTGTSYAVAKSRDASYQRLRRTVDLTGSTSGELSFKLSYDAEADYDYVFVEAHTVGQDDWTTLPDANGHTSTSVGESCDINWDTLHPFLAHYQTNVNTSTDPAQKDCTPTGTTGSWNAATGSSGGFQEWNVDLSAYAGKQVEVSITYAQDFGTAGLGAFVDDVSIARNGAVAEETSFEDGLGGFVAGPAPEGSADEAQWAQSPSVGYQEGPGVATRDTVYYGFGIEGVGSAARRAELVGSAMRHLGVRGARSARGR
jgi:hypothetical protein